MNIIKFRDVYLRRDMWEDECPYSDEQMQWFNEKLKGKYAYVPNWNWVFPLESITAQDYVYVSQENNPSIGGTCIDDLIIEAGEIENPLKGPSTEDPDASQIEEPAFCTMELFGSFIDESKTMSANSVDKYIALNRFSTDEDITLEEVKNFRTWLAQTLLDIKDPETFVRGEQKMLEYYANAMYDSTVDALTIFGDATPQYSVIGTSSCGCAGLSSGSSLQVGSVCDPLSIYRLGVYNLMVSLFSSHKYWIEIDSDDFLVEFKKYIDAVIQYNLPLYTSDWTTVFADCTCMNSSASLQEAGIAAMRNLSMALQYMIDGDTTGHKNFIDTALRVFASQYYEKMYWL